MAKQIEANDPQYRVVLVWRTGIPDQTETEYWGYFKNRGSARGYITKVRSPNHYTTASARRHESDLVDAWVEEDISNWQPVGETLKETLNYVRIRT